MRVRKQFIYKLESDIEMIYLRIAEIHSRFDVISNELRIALEADRPNMFFSENLQEIKKLILEIKNG